MRRMDVGMDMWIMPQMVDWDVTDLGLVLLMWAVMMATMMLPVILVPSVSAAPRAPRGISYGLARIQRRGDSRALGVLEAALLSPMMVSVSAPLSAAVLAAAGLFQFTPLKQASLVRCRSPWGAALNRSSATMASREGLR